jgi:hypothetical protein
MIYTQIARLAHSTMKLFSLVTIVREKVENVEESLKNDQ